MGGLDTTLVALLMRLTALRRFGIVAIGAAQILLVPAIHAGFAQTTPTTLRVETFVLPPFVTEQDGKLSGLSIDLWEEIAARLQVEGNYQSASDADAAFDALRSKKADVAVTMAFISRERQREFDFSVTILEAGQQVMVRGGAETLTQDPLLELLRLMFSSTSLTWLGIGTVLILVPAHIVWLFERRHSESIIPTRKYFSGIFHAAWWAASTLLTQAEQMPRQWLARVLAILWMFSGVVFVALYTAQLTTTLTVQQIRGAINGPQDLPGKRVGTLAGSVSAVYLRQHNVRAAEFTRTADMFEALRDETVDAVLFETPALRYYAAHEGKGLVRLVGSEFNKADLAIVFPDGSPLRKRVNDAVLAMREDGTYQRIYEKWFGGME
jgi:polar amino acid transport system substrate-binding protein